MLAHAIEALIMRITGLRSEDLRRLLCRVFQSAFLNRMLERLTSEETIKNALARISELIDAHGEWLYAQGARGGVCLRKSECDFRVAHGRLIFSCWTQEGPVVWRIKGWEWTGEKLLLEASRRMGAERAQLELIPR